MRAGLAGLGMPYPIGGLLPAVYQEDAFAMGWTQALDEVLAPAVVALDCLTAYLDPLLAPEDFLQWLAGWFGVALDENWPADRRRSVVAAAVGLYQSRGTVAGLRAHLELVTGGRVEISDSGAVAYSRVPGAAPPGEATARLTVRVTVAEPQQVNTRALDALIRAAKPAHVLHQLEVSGP
jgi:phage tail-like protein